MLDLLLATQRAGELYFWSLSAARATPNLADLADVPWQVYSEALIVDIDVYIYISIYT